MTLLRIAVKIVVWFALLLVMTVAAILLGATRGCRITR